MAGRVVVNNVEELSNYGQRLSTLKNEIQINVQRLVSLSDELKASAASMGNTTSGQASNWQDPQYNKLKSEVEPCISAVNTTSNSIKETASVIKTQMANIENSIAYINNLVRKLNDIS